MRNTVPMAPRCAAYTRAAAGCAVAGRSGPDAITVTAAATARIRPRRVRAGRPAARSPEGIDHSRIRREEDRLVGDHGRRLKRSPEARAPEDLAGGGVVGDRRSPEPLDAHEAFARHRCRRDLPDRQRLPALAPVADV